MLRVSPLGIPFILGIAEDGWILAETSVKIAGPRVGFAGLEGEFAEITQGPELGAYSLKVKEQNRRTFTRFAHHYQGVHSLCNMPTSFHSSLYSSNINVSCIQLKSSPS